MDLMRLTKVLTERLRSRRRAMGLTQEQLAERAGLSTNYIARLEIGSSVPSLSTLTRLSKALRIPIQDMLANEPPPISSADKCAALMLPLNEDETDYVIAQLRCAVEFVLSARKAGSES